MLDSGYKNGRICIYMANKIEPKLTEMTLRQLKARRRRLARGMPDLESVLQGSVLSQRRRCGKQGCRCTEGELHGPTCTCP